MPTSRIPRFPSTVLAALLLASGPALHGALPTFWRVATEADFLKGEVENLSVDAFGRLELGPSTQSVYETSAPFLWTTVTAPDGSVFIGSGNEGQVYRVDRDGRGTVFFDAEELEVHAIVPAPGGGLFVGTSPDGKVYKVDARGTGVVFFDPQDRYIWSLALDRGGNLFVATGDKGVIYKVAPDGTSSKFYETKATHAMALAFDRDGRLLAGTESPGRVFRIDASGRPFVVLDSSYSEVRALRLDQAGNAYALAVSGRPATGAGTSPAPAAGDASSAPTATVSTEISAVVVVGDAPGGAGASSVDAGTARTNQGPSSGAVYRITPDGVADLVWESREDMPFDVAMEPDGDVLVATGNKGKIYRLSGDPLRPTLVARANAQQVTALLRQPDGQTLFATSNPGRLMRLSSGSATRGTYTSDVRDAQTVATWGTLRWQARTPQGARVEIATRSGNTRTPDETWSDWTAAYAEPEGTAITSPRARYLQWRAVLTGAGGSSPVLTSVTAAYLPRNARPRVTGLTIYPPGTVFQRPFPTDPEIAGFNGETIDRRNLQAQPPAPAAPPLGRRAYQKGLLTFVWRAEDDNRDELVYEVSYRREGDDTWKPLKRGENDTILVWDTTSVPNGRYLLRVVASDSPSNSPSTALTGAFESQTFEIDNTPPSLVVTSVRRDGPRTVIAFDARDENSAIQRAEYSLDGERWVTLYPRDGIADSRIEHYELNVEGDVAARVLLRAADALNNVVSARGDTP